MSEAHILFAKEKYIQWRPGDVDRSMTIAALYVAQGCTSANGYSPSRLPSRQPMRRDVLAFLTSDTAVKYWLNAKSWLESLPGDRKWLCLTGDGLRVIASSYHQSENRADEERIRRWINDMRTGGGETDTKKTYTGPLHLPSERRLYRRTRSQAIVAMAQYVKANRQLIPSTMRLQREQVIRRLMSGMSEIEAFTF